MNQKTQHESLGRNTQISLQSLGRRNWANQHGHGYWYGPNETNIRIIVLSYTLYNLSGMVI